MKRIPVNAEVYIKFITYFGPALTGVTFWNNNKNTKKANELLTISDEAFIHLCIINYSATWKAQERQKRSKTSVEIPVSIAHLRVLS
jgi:LPS O-antigen subunit length determinant protein (WzzB/FepE family)